MKTNNLRKTDFTKLPYDKSAPMTIIVHQESVIADDQSTITLQMSDGGEDPGTFAFALFPLTFTADKQFSLTYGNDGDVCLAASALLVDWDTITITYPDKISTPKEMGVGLNIWWATGVTQIGLVGSPDLYAAISFGGKTKTLQNGNSIYFYLPS